MNIYLIRHTSVLNESSICYGQSDVSLSESFNEEREALKRKLRNQVFDACFSSPLSRCTTLAEQLYGIGFKTDNRLQEMNFGQWELKKWNEIEEKALREWTDNFVHAICPDGESFTMLYERSSEFWQEIKRLDYQNICIVTHGGVIRSILANILSIPLEKAFSIKVDFGSISKITLYEDSETVEYINL